MVHLVCVVALVLLGVSAASAQDRGALAIDEAAGRYALSLDGEADAVNMCGTTGCKVVATFSSCLGVAHSSPTQGQAVWTWFEADTAVVARQEAFDECQRAGGPACAGLNVICLTDSGRRDSGAAAAAQLPPDIQADRYLRQAEQAVRDGDAASARAAMERLVSLEQEHGLEPSPEDHYRYAQAWDWRLLYGQFGAHPDKASDNQTVQHFRYKVLRELKKIKMAWSGLNYSTARGVLILHPSTPAIAPVGQARLIS